MVFPPAVLAPAAIAFFSGEATIDPGKGLVLAYWTTETASAAGLAALLVGAAALLARRLGRAGDSALPTALVIVGCLLVGLGPAAWLNEHALKPALGVPRPNIIELERQGVLRMTAIEFYGLGDKATRSSYLESLPLDAAFAQLPPVVRAHWVRESGFSLPSGHSLVVMAIASYLFAWGTLLEQGRVRRLRWLLLPWAASVCASRVILGVHTPLDVAVGGALGMLVGSGLFFVAVSLWASKLESSLMRS